MCSFIGSFPSSLHLKLILRGESHEFPNPNLKKEFCSVGAALTSDLKAERECKGRQDRASAFLGPGSAKMGIKLRNAEKENIR
jgi:hypothetical protein